MYIFYGICVLHKSLALCGVVPQLYRQVKYTASRHKLAATNLIGPNRQISLCTVFKTNKKHKCNNNGPFTIAITF